MTRRVIGFVPMVLPAVCAGNGHMAQPQHSRGAKRRENTRLTRRFWRVAVEALVGIVLRSAVREGG